MSEEAALRRALLLILNSVKGGMNETQSNEQLCAIAEKACAGGVLGSFNAVVQERDDAIGNFRCYQMMYREMAEQRDRVCALVREAFTEGWLGAIDGERSLPHWRRSTVRKTLRHQFVIPGLYVDGDDRQPCPSCQGDNPKCAECNGEGYINDKGR